MNLCVLQGRLTSDPRKDKNNAVYFTLAVDRSYKTKDNKKITDFIECQCWNANAKFASNYFKKGTGINLTGELNTYATYDENKKQNGTKYIVKVITLEFPKGNKASSDVTNAK